MDLYSRGIVGWARSNDIRLPMALSDTDQPTV
jgi:hypothetical protein